MKITSPSWEGGGESIEPRGADGGCEYYPGAPKKGIDLTGGKGDGYGVGDTDPFSGRGRLTSMQRNNKLGVRGDGFSYIGTR